MPGCTVPNCTNSSQKGFKLFRFPSDKERNLIWVQNCGREKGWKPTKYTCVCEMHFEESQFESHRADGLRKLKPNAIPTIFSPLPHIRTYTRKAKKDNKIPLEDTNTSIPATKVDEAGSNTDEIHNEPDHTYPKYLIKIEDRVKERVNGDSTATEEVYVNVSVTSKPEENSRISSKERKFRPVKKLGKKCDDRQSAHMLRSSENRKRGRPPDPINKSRKVVKLSTVEEEQGREDVSSSTPNKLSNMGQKHCFVCGKVVEKGLSLLTLTNTTKVCMYQKIDKIVAGEMDLHVTEEGVLCSRCANLLNYMDRIEMELNMLKKAVLNCIRKKCGMEFKSDGTTATVEEKREHTGEQNDLHIEKPTRVDLSNCSTNDESCVRNRVISCQDIQDTSDENASPQQIQCQICKFKTIYKSVMVFHLRQHLKDVYWCDFCNVCLPGDAVSWINDDDDDLVVTATGDDVTEQEEVVNLHNSSTSSDGRCLLIVPISDEATTSQTVETEVGNTSGRTACLQGLRKSTKQIRVLNEMGKITLQEVSVSNSCEEGESCAVKSKPVELKLIQETEVSNEELEANRRLGNVKSYIMNEMGIVMLIDGQDVDSAPDEARVDMLSDSNENR